MRRNAWLFSVPPRSGGAELQAQQFSPAHLPEDRTVRHTMRRAPWCATTSTSPDQCDHGPHRQRRRSSSLRPASATIVHDGNFRNGAAHDRLPEDVRGELQRLPGFEVIPACSSRPMRPAQRPAALLRGHGIDRGCSKRCRRPEAGNLWHSRKVFRRRPRRVISAACVPKVTSSDASPDLFATSIVRGVEDSIDDNGMLPPDELSA